MSRLNKLNDQMTVSDLGVESNVSCGFSSAGCTIAEVVIDDSLSDEEMKRFFESMLTPIAIASAFTRNGELSYSDAVDEEVWNNGLCYERFIESSGKLNSISIRLFKKCAEDDFSFPTFYNWSFPKFWLWRLFKVKREENIDVTNVKLLQLVETEACGGTPVVLAAHLLRNVPNGKACESLKLGDQKFSVATEKRNNGRVLLSISCQSAYLPQIFAVPLFLILPLLGWLTPKIQRLQGKLAELSLATRVVATAAIAATIFVAVKQPDYVSPHSIAKNVSAFSAKVASHLRGILPAASEEKPTPHGDNYAVRESRVSDEAVRPSGMSSDAQANTVYTPAPKHDKRTQVFNPKPNRYTHLATTNERLHLSVRTSRPPSATKPKGVSGSLEQQLPVLFGRLIPATELVGSKESLGGQVKELSVSFSEPVQQGSDLSTRPKLYRGSDLVGLLNPVTIPVSSLASQQRTVGNTNRLLAEASKWLRSNDAIIIKGIQLLLASASK